MDSGGRIEKINSTAMSTGNTQATSADKELTATTERWQHGSTRIFHHGQIFRTIAIVRRNYMMHKILQKGECNDSVTVKFKSVTMFKTMTGEPKLPNQKQSILQSNRGTSKIKLGNSKD